MPNFLQYKILVGHINKQLKYIFNYYVKAKATKKDRYKIISIQLLLPSERKKANVNKLREESLVEGSNALIN